MIPHGCSYIKTFFLLLSISQTPFPAEKDSCQSVA